jgi:GntR family transcriptional regulator
VSPGRAGEAEPPSRGIGQRPGVTLYGEVARDIRERISLGEYPPGSRLPPENDFAGAYGVNRLTVRRALSELARANVIRTEHGVGSFVREPVLRHRVDDGHAGLAESMAARGLAVTHEPISAEILTRQALDETARSRLPDRWPDTLARIRFRRLLEGAPWSLSTAIMPAGLAPADWDGSASLSAVLADNGTSVVRAERSFSAASADEADARWLDIEPGTPVLVVTGLNADHHGNPVMVLEHRTRADRAEYTIQLTPTISTGK